MRSTINVTVKYSLQATIITNDPVKHKLNLTATIEIRRRHRGESTSSPLQLQASKEENLENEDPIEEKACRLLFTQRNITQVWFASAPPPKVAHLLLLTTHVMKPPPC